MKSLRTKFLLLELCLVLNWDTSTLVCVDEKSNWRGFLNFKRPEKEDKKAGKIFSGKLGDEKEGNNGIIMSWKTEKEVL